MVRVKLVTIPVQDQDRALKFYTEILDFKLNGDFPMGFGTQRWIELSSPIGEEVGVVLYTPEGQEDRIGTQSNIVFTSPDVEQTYQEWSSKGVEFIKPAQKSDWGGVEAVFKDCEGNIFALTSSN